MIRLAALSGAAAVMAVEPLAHRRELASTTGARVTNPPTAAEVVRSIGDGLGVDAVVEAAGTDDAVDLSVAVCRPGGRIVLAGIPDGNRTSFNASAARRKGLTFAMSRRMKNTYPRAIGLAVTGRINLPELVSHTFGLSDAEHAMTIAAQRVGHKVIIRP